MKLLTPVVVVVIMWVGLALCSDVGSVDGGWAAKALKQNTLKRGGNDESKQE